MNSYYPECPVCENEMASGDFGSDAVCLVCKKAWETDWDYFNGGDSMSFWVKKEIVDKNKVKELIREQQNDKS